MDQIQLEIVNDLKNEAESLGNLLGIEGNDIFETVVSYLNSPLDATITDDMMFIKSRDVYTYTHSLGVTCLSGMVIKELNISKELGEQVILGSFIHDIGKALIPQEILNKPGRLTPQEFSYIKAHPEIGYALVRNNPNLSNFVKSVPLHHHEREDGSGYPNGDRGNIPYEIKIISACDIVHALLSHRPYKKPLPIKEVIDILRNEPINSGVKEILINFLQKEIA